MEIGDRVQTLNTFVPITGEIVDMYKNLVTIADDDAETVDDLLSFHADDLEVISWTTKRSLNATKAKPKNTQTLHLNLVSWMTFIINFFITMTLKETLINTLVDSMSLEDLQQYVENDMADFLYNCSESEVIKNEFLIKINHTLDEQFYNKFVKEKGKDLF